VVHISSSLVSEIWLIKNVKSKLKENERKIKRKRKLLHFFGFGFGLDFGLVSLRYFDPRKKIFMLVNKNVTF